MTKPVLADLPHEYHNQVFIGIRKEIYMGKNTSVTLGEHFDDFIASQVQSGRYGSASEVIRAGLRLLETQETKMNTLRQLLIEGEQSGDADYDLDDFIDELDHEAE
jgi:antitoxin ParD1/3/4